MQTLTRTLFIDRFRVMALRKPDAPAVIDRGEVAFTYKQLLDAASELAAQLRAGGVLADDVVGIAIEKSPQYIAAMLGVWFSGAAFVPIDPRLPPERVSLILREAGIERLIAPHSMLPADQVAQLQTYEVDPAAREHLRSSMRRTLEDLAYIIFTSGSTGEPKGVMVTHRGIVGFLDAQIAGFRITSKSRCLFYLSTNFDASVSDIGTALLAGAALCIEDENILKPGDAFVRMLHDRQITHMDIPPSILAMLNPDEMPTSLEAVIIGGEACALSVVRAWAGKVHLVNVYGPTEATVCTSFGKCGEDWSVPLIGQPVAGINYLVLNDDSSEIVAGETGELYIGGVGLARGYLNKPELTDSKFVMRNGERLYRTGDSVRLLETGEIEFLGRTDRQFKLRGLLIEPEEVERRLKDHEAVQNAAVVKRPLSPSAKRDALVAFIERRVGLCVTPDDLRAYLADRLPRWMLPQHYEFLSQFPTTITGKIELSALKSLPLTRSVRGDDDVPRDQLHKLVAGVWSEVLGLDQVGDHEDFFDLGGDSFAVIEAAAAAESRGFKLPPALLMQFPTLLKLAEALRETAMDGLISSGGMTSEQIRAAIAFDEEVKSLLKTASQRRSAEENAADVASTLKGVGIKTKVQSKNSADKVDSVEVQAKRLRLDGTLSKRAQDHMTLSRPAAAKRVTSVSNSGMSQVLFTGATGFLGARVLIELLKDSEAKFFCIVRAADEIVATRRISDAFAKQNLVCSDDMWSRIRAVCGDLQSPQFGLDNASFEHLTQTVDTVVHNAATVNMLSSFENLRAANVDSVMEIVKFASRGKSKAVHYASTLSVFVATDQNEGIANESDYLTGTKVVYGGYAQTKWASEVILRQIDGTVAPVSFYRFGLITGDAETGLTSEHDFLCMFIQGISIIGCVPDSNLSISVDVTPIDFAASAMAHIALKDASAGVANTYHIANRSSLSLGALVHNMIQCGVKVDCVPVEQFLAAVKWKEDLHPSVSTASLALCRVLGDRESFDAHRMMDLFQATNIVFDTTNTDAALTDSLVRCPAPDDDLIQMYIKRALSNLAG